MRIQSIRRDTLNEEPRRSAGSEARLGQLLVEAGAISAADADRIAERQRVTGTSFGETALSLRLVSQDAIDRALARQFDFAISGDGRSAIDPALALAHGRKDEQSEAVRGLRAKLWNELAGHGLAPALTVAGTGGDRDSGVLTANLAIAFAQSGARTLLVDGNLRTPRLHPLFGQANQAGLSAFLAGRHAAPPIVPVAEIPQLALLPAGPVAPNPRELLGRLGPAMAMLREAWRAEIILVDAPALDRCDDAYSIAAAAPAILVVARRNYSAQRLLADAARQFDAIGAQIIGAVLDAA